MGKRFLLLFVLLTVSVGATPQESAPQDVIGFLSKTIAWYRAQITNLQTATEPGSAANAEESRLVADQVVRAAFDFARARAAAAAKPNGDETVASDELSRAESIAQRVTQADQDVKGLEGELVSSRQKLESATGAARQKLLSLIGETQSELELAKARRDALRSMANFVAGSTVTGPGATGLHAQVQALARSVPSELSRPLTDPAKSDTTKSDATKPDASKSDAIPLSGTATPMVAERPDPPGIWALIVDLYAVSRRLSALDAAMQQTNDLDQSSKLIRTPLIARLMDLTKKGDQLATAADTAGQKTLDEYKHDLDQLTIEFKQSAAATLPLSKQAVLMSVYLRGLSSWEAEVRTRYVAERRSLLVRLGGLAVMLVLLFILSRFGHRTIVRYVQDVRKRAQLLLLRKVVLWLAFALIVGFAFAGEIGSVATFAGLLTAGVALALQSVIVAVAGYFFLIGRLGIRVGDRVQISGVNGEVVEIGLVRLHLMEIGAGVPEIPTGRVVAFSNSIVFQPGVGLFKQIPGTSFRWHEITLTLGSGTDYTAARERLQAATDKVFADYQESMTEQSRHMEETFSATSVKELCPKVRLSFTATGLEAVVRYPIDPKNSAEIDERLTSELLQAVEKEPKLSTADTPPSIRLKTSLLAG